MIKGDQKARQYKRINNLHLLCQQRAWETDKAQWLRRFQADPFQSHYKNPGSEQKIPTARAEQYGDSHMLIWSFRKKNLAVRKVIKYGLNPNALGTTWLSHCNGTYIARRKTDIHTWTCNCTHSNLSCSDCWNATAVCLSRVLIHCSEELRVKQPAVQEYNLRIHDTSLSKRTFSWSAFASSNAGSANKCQNNRATRPRVRQREGILQSHLQSARISSTRSSPHASYSLFQAPFAGSRTPRSPSIGALPWGCWGRRPWVLSSHRTEDERGRSCTWWAEPVPGSHLHILF